MGLVDTDEGDVLERAAEGLSGFFFRGNLNEINISLKSGDKYPAILFPEPVDFTENNRTSPYLKEGRVQLFFVTKTNWRDWGPDEIHDNTIDGLKALSSSFVDNLKANREINDLVPFTTSKITHFGVQVSNGNQYLLPEEHAGVVLEFDMRIKRVYECN